MRFRELHSNIKYRILLQFFKTLVTSMVIPFLAIYFATNVGEAITSLMVITIIITGIIGGLIGGHLSDRIGRKKLMVITESGMCGTYALIALVNSPLMNSPILMFTIYVFNAFFSGAFEPAAQALIIDDSKPENRKFIFSSMYWAVNLAMAFGGVAGGFLFQNYRFELFIGLTLITLISLILTIFFIKDSYQISNQSNLANINNLKDKSNGLVNVLNNYKGVFVDRTFMIYVLACLLILSLEYQLTNFIGIRLKKELVNTTLFSSSMFSLQVDGIKMVGLLRAENTILIVCLTAIVSMIVKRFLDKSVLILGILLYSIGYSILAMTNSPWLLMLLMLFITIGELMYLPIMRAYIGNIAPEQSRSSYMAVNSLTNYGAMMIGGLFIALGTYFSTWLISLIFLCFGISSIACFKLIIPELDKRSDQESNRSISI